MHLPRNCCNPHWLWNRRERIAGLVSAPSNASCDRRLEGQLISGVPACPHLRQLPFSAPAAVRQCADGRSLGFCRNSQTYRYWLMSGGSMITIKDKDRSRKGRRIAGRSVKLRHRSGSRRQSAVSFGPPIVIEAPSRRPSFFFEALFTKDLVDRSERLDRMANGASVQVTQFGAWSAPR